MNGYGSEYEWVETLASKMIQIEKSIEFLPELEGLHVVFLSISKWPLYPGLINISHGASYCNFFQTA